MNEVTMIKLSEIVSVSLLVIAGAYGNGEERKNKLKTLGYDHTKVQSCVNDLIKIIDKYK
jgi:hypothetical protein